MRIVYLIHKTFYLNKLCRSRFLSVEEFCKKYNHELIYTGIGWGNFNENTFINENLKQLEPIDYIFCYKPNLYTGIHNVRYPKIIQYNEMYDILNTKEEIEKSRSDIIICHHENDVKKYEIIFTDQFYKDLIKNCEESPNKIINFITHQLQYCPINHPNKRVKEDEISENYVLSHQYLRIQFAIERKTIFIKSLTQ